MKTWPINWGFGGISWSRYVFRHWSLYVALRFGRPGSRPAIGFIVRWLPHRYRHSAPGFRIGRLLFVKYR